MALPDLAGGCRDPRCQRLDVITREDGLDHREQRLAELLAGLTTLVGGARFEQGARAAFALFDADGNRRLDAGEFGRFLAAHFRVLYRTVPAVRERMDGEGVTPEELAASWERPAEAPARASS